MYALLSAVQWVVGKALAAIANGPLEAWDATNNFGLNIEALRMELLLVKATLETAGHKQIGGEAMEELLGKLRHSTHCAEDLLDELDYFRIHDELHGTYDAADHHAKGRFHNLALNTCHTAKALVGSSTSFDPEEVEDARHHVRCCDWSSARQRSRVNLSSTPNTKQKVTGWMPKLGLCLGVPLYVVLALYSSILTTRVHTCHMDEDLVIVTNFFLPGHKSGVHMSVLIGFYVICMHTWVPLCPKTLLGWFGCENQNITMA